ncbi:MAG: tetratricopeptide repeat protein [Microcystis sp. M048S1]|uniref:tetratricopeptide repeat protein n=1 Tax=unclassified Microcystis TaxID=2643300 RepID=UPI00118EDE25|nr:MULTISPECIES: tetratricopeptide repeat protein [unclassified Microcystis]MCA2901063.1 tetratricopeptide repeat protein [Microcystis sp. M035S1]MCA2721404.1 tetratricopeptide repeat protein [Microcystis sp. M176S2]MCA2727790.1 tetratricopeptide repeat protein [Microcystis sp. M166S2]MCA2728794.1 tetratricopeptide repeat protein [Microcystis sp. M162S2]MCA2745197.1 tetratricopeptide repeat protein [Microcystis sp. M155S2]
MNKFLKIFTPISLILITVGFPAATFSNTVGVNTIFQVKGKVTVKKPQWKKTLPASVGLTLSFDDELEVAANASVKVYCSNLKQWMVKTGKYIVSNGCPRGNPVISLPNSNNLTLSLPNTIRPNTIPLRENMTPRPAGQREEVLAKLPYLITPRETNIITNRPSLRWNAVPGATNYTIKIDGVNWETQTNKTEIVYPGEPPLEAGKRYRVTIKADNGASSRSDAVVGFRVLDEQTQKTVLDAVKAVQQQQLSPEEAGLVLAHLYRGYELYGDAVEVLEGLVKQNSRVATVYQLLGDTYLKIGLPQLAKKPYEKALKLATNTQNLSVQAEIQAGLGIAYRLLGNKNEAIQWLTKAKGTYNQLGDTSQVQELAKTINDILRRE